MKLAKFINICLNLKEKFGDNLNITLKEDNNSETFCILDIKDQEICVSNRHLVFWIEEE